jgi:trans-aconitate methyltransferase
MAASGTSEFDRFAREYDDALKKGLRISGEGKDYFARGRVKWLSGLLKDLPPKRILDFGCGTGSAVPHLKEAFPEAEIVGTDVSEESLKVARETQPAASYVGPEALKGQEKFDAAYCNGVFHHIPIPDRDHAVQQVHAVLRPGGVFALFENNPWNPGTRLGMHLCPFDKDAITLTPPETRRLMARNGFQVLRTDYLFFFPRFLAFLRGLEPSLCNFPLGGQYLVLGAKPATS